MISICYRSLSAWTQVVKYVFYHINLMKKSLNKNLFIIFQEKNLSFDTSYNFFEGTEIEIEESVT